MTLGPSPSARANLGWTPGQTSGSLAARAGSGDLSGWSGVQAMTLGEAWNELLRAVPAHWVIGQPEYVPERRQWRLFSFAAHGSQEPTEMRTVYADSEAEALMGLAEALRKFP